MKRYPYAFHIALDGNGINGLEGRAGNCIFLFDPADNSYAYKIRFHDGVGGGHATTVDPTGSLGFLGNAGQHLLVYDSRTGEELDRISTLRFEIPDTSLRGSTHAVWLDERRFLTAVGTHLYLFDAKDLRKPEKIAPHGMALVHGMNRTASGRYVVFGAMDNPARGRHGEAREMGIWDTVTGEVRRVHLPATCWHTIPHRTDDLFYGVSFRVHPLDRGDYHEWGMAWLREYAFEVDAATGEVVRHWSAGRDIPAHINSDLTISDDELIFCNGASQTIVMIRLDDFASFRIIDERPNLSEQFANRRQVATQMYDVLARGGLFTQTHHLLGSLRISRFALVDSVHACKLSPDQTLLFTANRGLNHITIYDYPANTIRLRVRMPDIQEYLPVAKNADPRLGFHHGHLVAAET
ncbi:MAG: hypothetical protein GEU90_05785 [Gemmatimonas sp.]|nr:hypothetical protein [Gemmatimonas sp.]